MNFVEEIKVSIPKIYLWGKGFANGELANKWHNALQNIAETGYKGLNIVVSNDPIDNGVIAYAVDLKLSVHIHPMELSVCRIFDVFGAPSYTKDQFAELAKQSVASDKTLMLGLARELASRCGITDEPRIVYARFSRIEGFTIEA